MSKFDVKEIWVPKVERCYLEIEMNIKNQKLKKKITKTITIIVIVKNTGTKFKKQ